MASTFWYLEDGRCFTRRWSLMFYMLELVNDEIREIEEAWAFSEYLNYFIWDEKDDEYNGYGGFIRTSTGEDIMPSIDLREFIPENRRYFWIGTQRALRKLINANDVENEEMIHLFKTILDMHKRITKGENPQLLNDLIVTELYSGDKKGPGWE